MIDKLEQIEKRYESISQQLQDPGATSDQKKYKELMKEYSSLGEVVKVFRDYKKVASDYAGNKELLENEKDEELRQMAKEELSSLEKEKTSLEEQLKVLLLPKDPNDDKNIILEMRPGAGGDEAGLFADELFRA